MSFERKIIWKVYQEDGTFIETLNDVVDDLLIRKQVNGGDSEFTFQLDRKMDDFDEGTSIAFNNRVKVFVKDSYNPNGDKLVAYGYIVSYEPFMRGKEEGVEVTCLSAISKLSNDYYRIGSYANASDPSDPANLAKELTGMSADQMMEDIIDHYRLIESNSMLSNDYSNVDTTTDNTGGAITFDHRFFNMKHLDALREASKFFPRNKTGGYWFYWRIATDGKLWVKNISSTADHTFIIGRHIKEISGMKTIEGMVNRVYFWNEKGPSDPYYLQLTADDATSRTAYDTISEYVVDGKVTYPAAADLLASSRVYDGKDPKVKIEVTLNGDYDLASIKPGDTCKILNAKNNPFVIGSDTVLFIHELEYTVDEVKLTLSDSADKFEDIVENERQRLEKEMTWFGYISQQLTAAQLGPANKAWSTDLIFTASTYRQVDWDGPSAHSTWGTVYIPTGSSAGAIRVVVAGDTTTALGGYMAADTDYYLYLDESTFNTSASNSETGTGIIREGGDALYDSSKSWTTDQWAGYIVTIGGQTKLIRSNTATVLTIEDRWTISDQTSSYTIKMMTLDVTSDKSAATQDSKVIFSNVLRNSKTSSKATITMAGGSSSTSNNNFDGTDNIAERSIDGDRIIAKSITAGEIEAGTITADELSSALIYAGSITIDTNGNIKSGQTAYNTGTGWWIGDVSGTPKFSIGNSSGQRLTWDGSNLSVNGAITIASGSGISNLSDAGALATEDTVGASDCDTTIISGGKIITGLLTASNIQTGTLDASTVTVTNIDASNITTGTLSVGGGSQPSYITLAQSTLGVGGKLRWTGGSKIWEDTSSDMGINAVGGELYIYTNSNENAIFLDGLQTRFNEGISCRGPFNVGVPNSTTELARFTDVVYFNPTTNTEAHLVGGTTTIDSTTYYNSMSYNASEAHNFFVASSASAKMTANGFTIFGSGGGYGSLYLKNSNAIEFKDWTLTMDSNKTAIVKTSQGYNSLYCIESPEVWFMDFIENKESIDPLFEEVTVEPYHYVKCEDGFYQIWGKRKGHENFRFEQKTEEEFLANERFLRMNRPIKSRKKKNIVL